MQDEPDKRLLACLVSSSFYYSISLSFLTLYKPAPLHRSRGPGSPARLVDGAWEGLPIQRINWRVVSRQDKLVQGPAFGRDDSDEGRPEGCWWQLDMLGTVSE